ncbi:MULTISPECIES: cation-translocating P-type ATPase [Niastella]|uniref:Cation-translocating P-type ATPase n=1 Tax=Niastella soli TaxID=2821487 RepID=A0ABS3YUJ9_9BACT|nr:cation-translocating P-type ATPase [Niastella soli]MBO9201577.1 cation-translocating P-type ATPase [Niastella soli]
MSGKVTRAEGITGLSEKNIPGLQQQHGKNIFQYEKPRQLYQVFMDIVREPMFLLLLLACIIYFLLGQLAEGFMMLIATCFVATISLYQDIRSTKALEALKQFTEPMVTVIRDGIEKNIQTRELVPGDVIKLEEGNKIPADAIIIQANDLTVNESIITGESIPVEKDETTGHNAVYQGATINSGLCYASVSATGNSTVLGKLGKVITAITVPKTLLQLQVNKFVRQLAVFGISAFLVIWAINFIKTGLWVESLLFALTLAMAAVPEEIPVALTSFMALGAWQMSKLGIISRQPQIIENLGSVNVICLDKTGTITENQMTVKAIYDFEKDVLIDTGPEWKNSLVLQYAMLASERNPFDAMEKAIQEANMQYIIHPYWRTLTQVYEYPLQGRPPMMTHVYSKNNHYIAAAKGAPERIVQVSNLRDNQRQQITRYATEQAEKGYRVIGVASAIRKDKPFPETQDAFNWQFEGLLCLYDPPRKNINQVIKQLYEAHIDVKLLTGDYAETAVNICKQTGIKGYLRYITGDQILAMKEDELKKSVEEVSLFVRMFPEAKLQVINALKNNGHIVAMTGDGVNDAPALKASDIGIALGKKGTEMAKQAADLIITDDDLGKVVEAIRQGRKIFSNLKKAIRYIISIHIPIILTASVPLLLGWKYPNIFTPIHIIFLELIMGPTCSIFFEREPVEENIMALPPRRRTISLFEQDELLISIVQGLMITTGVLWLYHFSMNNGASISHTRTLVFTTLVISNIFLTFTNRSFMQNFTKTIHYKNKLAPWVLLISVLFLIVINLVPAIQSIFGLSTITFTNLLLCTGVAFVAVIWFEIYKTNLYKPEQPFIRKKR